MVMRGDVDLLFMTDGNLDDSGRERDRRFFGAG
jgi:hypothetical protein